jgi:hypothetical protein
MNAPCFQCPERAADCHTRCERYLAVKAARDACREERWKSNIARYVLMEGCIKARRIAKKDRYR